MLCGIGYRQTEVVFALLDLPVITARNFRENEKKVDEMWSSKLEEKMRFHIEQEISLAKEEGRIMDNGMPFITVMVDGGWSKRSYGHGFNANSGLAVIIGAATKKILYMGVKNKFCAGCLVLPKKEHQCNKNYSGPSTGMEWTIIVEGFRELYNKHGVFCKYIIGDGDSNTYQKIRELTPRGKEVVKYECANHVTRNYTGKLHKLMTSKDYPPEQRSLVKQLIPRLTKAVRGAIRQNDGRNVEYLLEDLRNGPRHVFGDHSHCRDEYCTRKNDEEEENLVPMMSKNKLFQKLEELVDVYVAQKADRLTLNLTTNYCENLMGLVCLLTGGKRVNFARGGSYRRRTVAAGLVHSGGMPACISSPWKSAVGKSPGRVTKRFVSRRVTLLQDQRRRRMRNGEEGKGSRRRKSGGSAAPADSNYGATIEQFPDADAVTFEEQKQDILLKLEREVQTPEDAAALEVATRGQTSSSNDAWKKARENRLTASHFGAVCTRQEATLCHNLVKAITVPAVLKSAAVLYGQRNEKTAIQAYEAKFNVHVQPCGLFVHPDHPYLGASPDGLAGDHGLVEVKCVPSIGCTPILDALEDKHLRSHLPLERVKGDKKQRGEVRVKRGHKYFYQIQGQLALTERSWCDLVVYAPAGWESFRVEKDDKFWEEKMLPKLKRFYHDCLLPELANSRIVRGLECREPDYVLQAKQEKDKKKIARYEEKRNREISKQGKTLKIDGRNKEKKKISRTKISTTK